MGHFRTSLDDCVPLATRLCDAVSKWTKDPGEAAGAVMLVIAEMVCSWGIDLDKFIEELRGTVAHVQGRRNRPSIVAPV